MTYVDFLTVTLTALAVILAAVTVGIAVLAIWGYVSLREGITKSVTAAAAKRLDAKLREYPDATQFHELFRALTEEKKQQAEVRSKLKNSPNADDEAGETATASKRKRAPAKTDTIGDKYPRSGK